MSLKKFKQINYKKILIFLLAFLLGVIAGYLVLSPSYALYEEKKNFDVINGTVEDPGDIYFAYYVDGVISRNMPLQNTGYTLDETKSGLCQIFRPLFGRVSELEMDFSKLSGDKYPIEE